MFSEHVGELVNLDGRALIKTRPGMIGCAVHGPYETLQPGRYRVDFHIKTLGDPTDERDPLCATVDIVSNVEMKLTESLVFWSQIAPDGRFSVWFQIDQWLSWMEYRVFVNGVEPLVLGDAPSAIRVDEAEPPVHHALPALFVDEEKRIRALFFAGVGVAALQQSLVVAVAASQWRLVTRDDFSIVDEIISKNNFSIMHPSPVCGTLSDAGRRKTNAQAVVFGTCTAYGQFGFAMVGCVMDALHGEHRRIHCQSFAELQARWSEQKGKPVLITSDQPDAALSDLLTTSGFPVLAFFDHPATALADTMRSRGVDLPEAIRFCSRNFSGLAACAGSKSLTKFGSEFYKYTLAEAIHAVCAAVSGEENESLTANALQRLTLQEGVAGDTTVETAVRLHLQKEAGAVLTPPAPLDAERRALVDWFGSNYGPMLTGAENDVNWPRELFSAGLNGETADAEVKLVGGRRFLVWGPYLSLPVGAWRACVQIEVVDNFSGNELEADIFAPYMQISLAKCIAKLPALGNFQFTLDFVNADPGAPLEIRIFMLMGAIEGHFALRHVTMQPMAEVGGTVAASVRRRHAYLQNTPASSSAATQIADAGVRLSA